MTSKYNGDDGDAVSFYMTALIKDT